MTKTTVTPKRVREIIAAYGADPARWPAAERTAALAILRDDAELSALLQDARRLDAALDSFAPPLPTVNAADVAGRIMAAARQTPTPRPRMRRHRSRSGAGSAGRKSRGWRWPA